MIGKILRRLSEGLLLIALVTMLSTVILQVFTRYVLKIPLYWTDEVARYCMIWAAFLGAALGISQGVHTSVQWFTSFLPERIKSLVAIISNATVVLFAATTIFATSELAPFLKFQVSPAMRIPMIVPYSAFFVGFILIAGYQIQEILNIINTDFMSKRGREEKSL